MTEPLRVAVCGAAGRMGRAVVRAVTFQPDMRLVAAFGRQRGIGQDAGSVAGAGPLGVAIEPAEGVGRLGGVADVLVEFSVGDGAVHNAVRAARVGVRPVVGATGYAPGRLDELAQACAQAHIGGLVAPNFALGAVLMMEFAQRAAAYFPHAEIIELHHDRKRDAPSGTAARTAHLIAAARGRVPQPAVQEEETAPGARGASQAGVRVHSVRLPGLVAHQEVIFGGPGQTLTIRHDSVSEESFLSGVLLAIRRVGALDSLVVGLERLLHIEEGG
ncbi:MAG: 4-hydroxy-tetrahydrodipicolinate reductase [Armatimonadota bacterium]|nr:4-hydroxy-tetrahydrodipicolinate reductase [Armatimonadota bacterium]MDR5697582.1 4-hydroxy-tetrahydrodipicolinate reductase [Armatimonadota bacterium]